MGKIRIGRKYIAYFFYYEEAFPNGENKGFSHRNKAPL